MEDGLKDKFDKIEQHDFFAENEKWFYESCDVNSILVQGEHWNKPPMITILITTFKRVNLLKLALDSALNQIGFDDYQIIVVDNEGVDINIETPTSVLMKQYKNIDRVLYYRHEKETFNREDNAVKLAKSKWIMFLHDDDMLNPYILITMIEVLHKLKDIKFLACQHTRVNERFKGGKAEYNYSNYYIKKRLKEWLCFDYYVFWQGALIDRKAYISVGGDRSLSIGFGDLIMVQKFHYRYCVYDLHTSVPLYYERVWHNQSSFSGTEMWTSILSYEYHYNKYVIRKFHHFNTGYWDRIASYHILEKAYMDNEIYGCNIDLMKLTNTAGMAKDSLLRTDLFFSDFIKQSFYKDFMDKIHPPIIEKGVIDYTKITKS